MLALHRAEVGEPAQGDVGVVEEGGLLDGGWVGSQPTLYQMGLDRWFVAAPALVAPVGKHLDVDGREAFSESVEFR